MQVLDEVHDCGEHNQSIKRGEVLHHSQHRLRARRKKDKERCIMD